MEKRYEIGNFIYELRREKGYTQKELGEILGVTNKAVSKWETGAAIPRMETLQRLAQLLGCTQEELFLGHRIERTGQTARGENVTASYVELMRRCDTCRHEGMSLLALCCPRRRKKRGLRCKKCGAELRLSGKSGFLFGALILLLVLFVYGLLSLVSLNIQMLDPLSPKMFPTLELAQAYRLLAEQEGGFAAVLRMERVEAACTLLIAAEAAVGLWFLLEKLAEKLLIPRMRFKIVHYPHAEDGKIVL